MDDYRSTDDRLASAVLYARAVAGAGGRQAQAYADDALATVVRLARLLEREQAAVRVTLPACGLSPAAVRAARAAILAGEG